MSNLEKYLTMLQSEKASVRYEACEELRVSENLPKSALLALQTATNDNDPLVADAARRALLLHSEPAISEQSLLNDAHGSKNGTVDGEICARMMKDIRSWGLVLLVLGVIHIFASGFFSAPWGILLILVGLASFYFREAAMFVIYAVTLAWAGISNIASGQFGWVAFAIIQLILVISVFRKFAHYRRAQNSLKQVDRSDISSTSLPTEHAHAVFPWAGCILGSLSFVGLIATLFGIGISLATSGSEEAPVFWAFLETLFVIFGVLGVSVSLASLLSGFRRKLLAVGGIVTSALVLVFEFGMALIY